MLIAYLSGVATVLIICCNIVFTGHFPGKFAIFIIALVFAIVAEIIAEQFSLKPTKYVDDERLDIDILKTKYWNSFLFKFIRCLYIGSMLISLFYIKKLLIIRDFSRIKWILILLALFLLCIDVIIYKITYKKVEERTVIRNTIAFECNCISSIALVFVLIFVLEIVLKMIVVMLLVVLIITFGWIEKIFG